MLAETSPGQAQLHIEKAQSFERRGRLEEAMHELKRAVEADPTIATVHFALGQHYMRKGLAAKAVDEFEVAARLAGDYETLYSLGHALVELERFQEAASAFRRCLDLAPQDPSARYELAYCVYAGRQYEAALEAYRSLAEEFPDDWDLSSAVAECELQLGHYGAAEDAVRRALAVASSEADTEELQETLEEALRYQEFPPARRLTAKDRLYAKHGIACLGSSQDDGLRVPVYQRNQFTYHDVAVTVERLVRLAMAMEWQLGAVLSLGPASQPLASAIATLLQLPLLDAPESGRAQRVLAVMAMDTMPELLQVAREATDEDTFSFAFALARAELRHPLPDIVGVQCAPGLTVPWSSPRLDPAASAAKLLTHVRRLTRESNLDRQLAYFVTRHRRIRASAGPMGRLTD